MSDFKGTPGPWDVWNGTDVFTSSQEDEGWHVADCDVHHDQFSNLPEMTPIERRANARLIAAAPELLEALQAIMKACEACENDDNLSIVDLFTEEMESAARAAIAKATQP